MIWCCYARPNGSKQNSHNANSFILKNLNYYSCKLILSGILKRLIIIGHERAFLRTLCNGTSRTMGNYHVEDLPENILQSIKWGTIMVWKIDLGV
jgi:hypothetical protein